MKGLLFAGVGLLVLAAPIAAQPAHPLIAKSVELGIANQVISNRCAGLALNPAVTAQLLAAIGLLGLTSEFERIDPLEVQRLADIAKAEQWPPTEISTRCQQAASLTMPNPLKPGETLPVFVNTQ